MSFSYAARTLRKSPVFTITAALTIALGMGAGTAIFSVARAVLLRPLPYRDPGRLVIACGDMLKRNVKDFPLSNVDYLDIRQQAHAAFEGFAAVQTFRGTLPRTDGGPPDPVIGAVVSSNFFRLMGGPIVTGRDFTESDAALQPAVPANAPPGTAPPALLPRYVVLSYEYWQKRFGGDHSIFGRPLPGVPAPNGLVPVGVAAPHFELLFPPDSNLEVSPDFWVCARIPYDTANRNNVQWRAIGRMKEGVSLDRAQAEADAVSEQIRPGGGPTGDSGADGRGDFSAVDRLRECGEPAASPRHAGLLAFPPERRTACSSMIARPCGCQK